MAPNCGDIVCRGFAYCDENRPVPVCECDPGYIEQGGDCVQDETCIQLRSLRPRCRQMYNDAPAVANFFAVDFCSGAPVPTSHLGNLDEAFVVYEDGVDISLNPEASATVIDRGVESFVAIMLDVSESLLLSQDLPLLMAGVRSFVTGLTPGPGDEPVYVAVYLFGDAVAEYVPFTSDLAEVDFQLNALEQDTQIAIDLVGADGTALYNAVARGLDETDRIRELREGVTDDGVLTTGTVVVITDGENSVGGTLDQAQLDATLNNVISIGISSTINHDDLQAIGQDGSFLAPDPGDWSVAFDDITDRVEKYPDRAYLLGYCSSKNTGVHSFEITLAPPLASTTGAPCSFEADLFAAEPAPICDAALFQSECAAAQCGGLTACGECTDSQCCVGKTCQAPTLQYNPCGGDHHLCIQADMVCLPTGDCGPPAALTEACNETNQLCQLTVGYCDPDNGNTCQPVFLDGVECDSHLQCASLNCASSKPLNPLVHETCQPGEPGARLHQPCSESIECELGGVCEGGECEVKTRFFDSCFSNQECYFAECTDYGPAGDFCGGSACFFAWDDKIAG